nr:hypothetical protein [Tanacetum cinerariifolium]
SLATAKATPPKISIKCCALSPLQPYDVPLGKLQILFNTKSLWIKRDCTPSGKEDKVRGGAKGCLASSSCKESGADGATPEDVSTLIVAVMPISKFKFALNYVSFVMFI